MKKNLIKIRRRRRPNLLSASHLCLPTVYDAGRVVASRRIFVSPTAYVYYDLLFCRTLSKRKFEKQKQKQAAHIKSGFFFFFDANRMKHLKGFFFFFNKSYKTSRSQNKPLSIYNHLPGNARRGVVIRTETISKIFFNYADSRSRHNNNTTGKIVAIAKRIARLVFSVFKSFHNVARVQYKPPPPPPPARTGNCLTDLKYSIPLLYIMTFLLLSGWIDYTCKTCQSKCPTAVRVYAWFCERKNVFYLFLFFFSDSNANGEANRNLILLLFSTALKIYFLVLRI